MKLSKTQREQIWNKYNKHCAYCGCELNYKDMQVDHIKPAFHNWSEKDKEKLLPKDYAGDDSIENLNPSCRACNFRKGSNNIEGFREELQHGLLCCQRNFTYRMMIKYGLVEEHPQEIKFYFEKINDRN